MQGKVASVPLPGGPLHFSHPVRWEYPDQRMRCTNMNQTLATWSYVIIYNLINHVIIAR